MHLDQVEESSNLPQDLDNFLLRKKWEQALGILDELVRRGEAINGAVEDTEADPRDIRRCHPEVVILLRGQNYTELKGKDSCLANTYYQDTINSVYPEDTSTGSYFADKLLERLRNPKARLR